MTIYRKSRTEIVYQDVINGQAIPLPKLRHEFEGELPNHAQIFHNILIDEGLVGWRIKCMPSAEPNYRIYGQGACVECLHLIILRLSSAYQMLLTLYHEIMHALHPHNLTELEAELMAMKRLENISDELEGKLLDTRASPAPPED